MGAQRLCTVIAPEDRAGSHAHTARGLDIPDDAGPEVTTMSEATLRSKTNVALWLALSIMLVPLVPYALKGSGL